MENTPLKKTAITLFLFTLLFQQIKAQDRIINQTGDVIYCKIKSVDSLQIKFEVHNPNAEERWVKKTIDRIDVSSYNYQYKYTTTSNYKVDTLKTLDVALVYKTNGRPVTILKNGRHLKISEILKEIKNDPKAYALYRKWHRTFGVAKIFAYIGGALIGVSLGESLSGQIDGGSALALVGTGGVCIGIGYAILPNAQKKLFKSVKTYEANQSNSSPVK